MSRKNRETLISIVPIALLFTTLSLYIFRNFLSGERIRLSSPVFKNPSATNRHLSYLIEETFLDRSYITQSFQMDSVLLPDWEVLIVISPDNPLFLNPADRYSCLFQNRAISPAKFTGFLQFSNRVTYKCVVPNSARRRRPLLMPILTKSPENPLSFPRQEIFRWSFLVYESLSTETDIVLFAKGVNNRQGVNRPPEELNCIFHNGVNYSVKTAVTSSSQEVFRCNHPSELIPEGDEKIKISIVIGDIGVTVPSVTYYKPYKSTNNVEQEEGKLLLCACTMVHNVAKFLKEWVVYHSKLGIEKFILYDNVSDDNLQKVVAELVEEQYDVKTFLWPWPKTQEAGFSHSAIYAKDSCTWMMYMDVDEFVFSPSWLNSSYPSHDMLPSLLPSGESDWLSRPIGQVSIRCLEFGPSNQQSHPTAGVTQGYTCRRIFENRHKSIVLLDAIDDKLNNAIHHFLLKEGYRGQTLSLQEGVVNHYKYQAWAEFKAKFRRRVSAYVVDWRQAVNPMSKDRTPGLGFEAIEPQGWSNKFCEVNDTRLKVASQKWFSLDSTMDPKMAWQ